MKKIWFYSYTQYIGKSLKKAILTFFAMCIAGLSSSAFAAQDLYFNDLNGKPFWHIHAYDEGEGFPEWGEDFISGFTINENEKNSIATGLNYWTHVLNAYFGSNTMGVTILIPKLSYDDNASAGSFFRDNGYTFLGDAIVNGTECEDFIADMRLNRPSYNRDGGINAWYSGPMAAIPENGISSDLSSTILHEFGHALGMIDNTIKKDEDKRYHYDDFLSNWSSHLRSSYNKEEQPTAGMLVSAFHPHDTDAEKYGLYFTGDKVLDVLDGAKLGYADGVGYQNTEMQGLPIKGWEYGFPDFSHIELQNSLMSHQLYRNWAVYMEAELAMMQDIGFDIDRKFFFGHSLYTSGSPEEPAYYTNNNPFFDRNESGTAYRENTYNIAPYGVGFHVYGSNNVITQSADLLTKGLYGIGIRMDGVSNGITIADGIKVHANGYGGTALAVSYGKNHTVVHKGELQATGSNGIAARFDFGSNTVGNYYEYRGSYFRIKGIASNPPTVDTYGEEPLIFDHWAKYSVTPSINDLGAINGSLVNNFDVTGSLNGSRAAIYISDNAHVGNINIMNGASLCGDIISQWDPYLKKFKQDGQDDGSNLLFDVDPENLYTKLTFGLKKNADSTSIKETSDTDFRLSYTGNIKGADSIVMGVRGGKLTFNGTADVYNVSVDSGATLAGAAYYRINNENSNIFNDGTNDIVHGFVNNGTLLAYNPDDCTSMVGMTIEAPTFDNTGALGVRFNGQGDTTKLILEGGGAGKDETFSELLLRKH